MAKNTLKKALKHEIYKTLDVAELLGEVYEPYDQEYEPEYLAGMALELATLHTEISAALEILKAKLRDTARDDLPANSPTPAQVTIQGEGYESETLGTVTVTFPAKTIKTRKDTDLQQLKRALGPAFSDYFEEQTTYTPVDDFENKTLKASGPGRSPTKAAEARLALSAVEVTARPTPRVSFNYNPDPSQ